jgi:4-amino-4-deoxy-L-arabinose transferase-like glycosyltransferase
MDWFSPEYLNFVISTYGYWAVGMIVALESMGFAGSRRDRACARCAICWAPSRPAHRGSRRVRCDGRHRRRHIGYLLGRGFGYRLLLRYGRYVALSDARIKFGHYLFWRHGGKVVFFGRFIAVLRVLAAFLAGANRMDWRHFLLSNAAGGILWACIFGLGAYTFGKALLRITGPLSAALLISS